MERTDWYNHKGHIFRIKKDSYYKIKELGENAGKYLIFNTLNGIEDTYELTDTRTIFNSNRTWKYMSDYKEYNYENECWTEPLELYDILAFSLGYIYNKAQLIKFLETKQKR